MSNSEFSTITSELEDLVMDFIMYRKSKKSSNYTMQSQYEIGKGWPYYKNIDLSPSAIEMEQISSQNSKSTMAVPATLPQDMNYCRNEQTGEYINFAEHNEDNILPAPLELSDYALEPDMEYMKNLFGIIGKNILPCIEKVLSEYEYDGSPIYNDHIDKETFEIIIDKILDAAVDILKEIKDIQTEIKQVDVGWDRRNILRELIGSHVLHNIYGIRRPRYRRHLRDHIHRPDHHRYYGR